MLQAKVFITRHLPIELEQQRSLATVEVWPERQPPPYEILLEKVKEIDGLLCLLTDQIDRQLIETGKLKVISQMAVGYDNNLEIVKVEVNKPESDRHDIQAGDLRELQETICSPAFLPHSQITDIAISDWQRWLGTDVLRWHVACKVLPRIYALDRKVSNLKPQLLL